MNAQMETANVDTDLKAAYDQQYDQLNLDRRLEGGRLKASHVIALAGSYRPRTVLEVGAGDGSDPISP